VCEIGVGGGHSLGAWAEYFSDIGAVNGLAFETDPEKSRNEACKILSSHTKCKAIDVSILDQSDRAGLRKFVERNPAGWDLLVDDGSHDWLRSGLIIIIKGIWKEFVCRNFTRISYISYFIEMEFYLHSCFQALRLVPRGPLFESDVLLARDLVVYAAHLWVI
jgi:hypothetical protein